MSIARPVSLLLNSIALALCLYALLLVPNVAALLLAVVYATAIGIVATRQPRWIAISTALFCMVLGVVCTIAAVEIWMTGDWYGTPASRVAFFAALVPLGAIGPLLTVVVLYRQYIRPGSAER